MSFKSAKPSLGAHLRYAFDRWLGLGTGAQVGMLGLLVLAVIALAVGFLLLSGIQPDGHPHGFTLAEAVWVTLAHLFDGGTMGADPQDWPYRAVMLVVTITGLLLISALIGLLTTGLVRTFEDLRRGRSTVLETGHTLILGWSPAVFTIVSELAIANQGRKRPRIVILAEHDKVAMEHEIRQKVPHLGATRVICRTGSPIDPADIAIVTPDNARAIIVLSSDSPDADTQVIKTILALTHNPDRKASKYHIVAELRDPKKREVAALVGKDELEVILSSEVVTRLTVQTCFQSGLSLVYHELFDFAGDEIYLRQEAALQGKTFRDALYAYPNGSVIGLKNAQGKIRLNPPLETKITEDDALFIITRDDKSFALAPPHPVDKTALRTDQAPRNEKPRKTLILGWNRRAPALLKELDYYVTEGSEVTVVADLDEPREISQVRPLLKHQRLWFWRGDTTDFSTLEALDLWNYQHIIVLGYTEILGQQQADAHTLETLLYLRTLVERTGAKANIVSEMLHAQNRDLAKVTQVDDFIVSHTLISLMLAQVAENKHLNGVFADLLDTEGMEIYLRPAANYVELSRPVNFYTVVAAAAERGEICIGHRLLDPCHGPSPRGVQLNPPKTEHTAYGPTDRIIVIGED